MNWSEEEKRKLVAMVDESRHDGDGLVFAVATKAAELLAARGGTMTAEQIAGLREWSDKTEGCHPANVRMLLKHSDALSARVAVLKEEKAELMTRAETAEADLIDTCAELAEARATIARLTAAGQALSEHADKAGGPAPGQCANPDPTTGPTCTERGCEGQTCQYPKVKSGCDCAVKNIACIHWAARVRAPETP